jgi:hypothetical protein
VLFYLTPEVIRTLLGIVGLADTAFTHFLLAKLYRLLAILASPLGLAAFLIPPPLIARTKNRRFWLWLLAAIFLGPYSLVILFLPKVSYSDPAHHGEAFLQCPDCARHYYPSDYLASSQNWYCSHCRAEIPRTPRSAA